MVTQRDQLDGIAIPSPCSADWDSMAGNDQVRFCQHCQLSVFNLSSMTRTQAMQLVRISQGKLCVRFYRSVDGKVRTTDELKPSYRISRRVSRIAATGFSVALTLASRGLGQSSIPAQGVKTAQVSPLFQLHQTSGSRSAAIFGTVKDPSGYVIEGATIVLKNKAGEKVTDTLSGTDGTYTLPSIDPGEYRLDVSANGFHIVVIDKIDVDSGSRQRVDATLVVGTMGGEIIATAVIVDPLVSASSKNDLKEAKVLLATGVLVNVIDRAINSSALSEAVISGNRELIHTLLAAGADVNLANGHHVTPLMNFTGHSTANYIITLIPRMSKNNDQLEPNISQAIKSIRSENEQIIKLLLDAHAQVNLADDKGETALSRAARGGMWDWVDDFLNRNDSPGQSVLESHPEVMVEIRQGSAAIVKDLLGAGADVNHRTNAGETPLMIAAAQDNPEIVRLLLEAGAKIDAVDGDRQSALMIAAAAGRTESVVALLEAKADVTIENFQSLTALGLAQQNGCAEVIAVLRQYNVIK